MSSPVFVTGNQSKADYLAKYLDIELAHKKIDLDEIQSLNLSEIVEHKVKQAYKILQLPVIVEDVALEFKAFGRLPGTFIKFFLSELSLEQLCRMLDGTDRIATARCVFGYYDGQDLKLFESHLTGKIAKHPSGDNGFGWDKIFIPKGYNKTRAALSAIDDKKTYMQIKPFNQLKEFIKSRNYS